ncbi:MAG: hypothetical protein U9R57_07660 [Thermodesulfobacteriota bacterium]|nr:hypothetical protein [Thermodesulfobacteriota bacterium]
MKRTYKAPLLVLLGIIGLCALMAETNIFDPLIHFIHTGEITTLQAVACLVFTVVGFAAYFHLLSLLCSYFVPRIGGDHNSNGATLPTKLMEEN